MAEAKGKVKTKDNYVKQENVNKRLITLNQQMIGIQQEITKLRQQARDADKEIIFYLNVLPCIDSNALIYIFSDYLDNKVITSILSNYTSKFSLITVPIYFAKLYNGTDKLNLWGNFISVQLLLQDYPDIAKSLGVNIDKDQITISKAVSTLIYCDKINNVKEQLYSANFSDSIYNYLSKFSTNREIYIGEDQILYAHLYRAEIEIIAFNDKKLLKYHI